MKHYTVRPKGVTASEKVTGETIVAADDDFVTEDETGLNDALDDVQDQVEDIQDQVEDIDEDEIDIEVNNNIDGHYIAECDRCHQVFISAVVESDQDVESISGVCPLCGKESEQLLKWIIRSKEDSK